MVPRLLLDTHIVVRWLTEFRRLSNDQSRAIEAAVRRREPLGVCTMTLAEIGFLLSTGGHRLKATPQELLDMLANSVEFVFLPVTVEITSDIASIGASLRDPADRIIVATARVHRLHLVTSDQRIIESKFVTTIE